MTPEQRITRSHQVAQALEFSAPVFDALVADYLAKQRQVATSAPRDWSDHTDVIIKLSQAVRVVEEVRRQFEALVADGRQAAAEIDAARKIVEMSASDRNLVNIGARRA